MNADLHAEQAVIGCLLMSAGRVADTLGLAAEDFHGPLHEELWNAAHTLMGTGRPLDAGLLLAHVGQRSAALAPVITECVGQAVVADTARWHAINLRAHTARRRIEAAAASLAQLASTQQEMTPDEIAEAARGLVDRHTERTVDTGGTITYGDAVFAGLDRWNTPDTNVLPTGWTDLDEHLNGGLRPGHLTVVGARPGIGKSLLATELARQVASTNTGVLFSSLEMSRADVADRITASLTRVPLTALTGGTANEDQMDRLGNLLSQVADWPLHIDDRSHVGITAIRGKARDITRHPRGLGMIIVDYLQLVSPADRKAPREQQVASVSRGLKLLARDLNVPVVALAQVNRGSVQADNKRPLMSHLRESGAIEADADEILLLHRDEQMPGDIEINVVKNRHGQTGPIRLGWAPYRGSVSNLSPYGSAA